MKLILIPILTLFTISAFGQGDVVVSGNVVPYSGNPIVHNNTHRWDSIDVAGVQVFRDSAGARFVMNVSGYGVIAGATDSLRWRVGLYYSTDLINWTADSHNPVFSPLVSEGYIAANGCIHWVNSVSKWVMLYNTANANGSNNGTRCAWSTDLINWVRKDSGSFCIPNGGSGSYDQNGCYDPNYIIKSDGSMDLFYSAQSGSGVNTIAEANSTDGGLTWTKQGVVLNAQPWFNTGNFGGSSQYKYGGALFMNWDASVTINYRHIGGGVSFDNGKSWNFYGFLLNKGGSGSWDSAQDLDANLFPWNGKIYLFYSGATLSGGTSGLNAQIGVAIGSFPERSKPSGQ